VSESKAGVQRTQAWEGAVLVGMEQSHGAGDGRHPDRHDSFEDF